MVKAPSSLRFMIAVSMSTNWGGWRAKRRVARGSPMFSFLHFNTILSIGQRWTKERREGKGREKRRRKGGGKGKGRGKEVGGIKEGGRRGQTGHSCKNNITTNSKHSHLHFWNTIFWNITIIEVPSNETIAPPRRDTPSSSFPLLEWGLRGPHGLQAAILSRPITYHLLHQTEINDCRRERTTSYKEMHCTN